MVLDACSHHDDDVKTFAWCVFLMPSNPIQYGRFKGLISYFTRGVHSTYYVLCIFSGTCTVVYVYSYSQDSRLTRFSFLKKNEK